MNGYAATDTDRRLGNVITIGRVLAVDPANGVAQIDLDGPSTDWIPWVTARAGGDRTWWAPEVGEQVLVAAPGGELSNGVIVGCLFQDAHPEPADSLDQHKTVYADGTVVQYDRAAHQYTIDVSASAGSVVVICKTANVQASESVTVQAPTGMFDIENSTFTGTVTINGLLTWNGGQKGSGGSGVTSEISGNTNFKDGTLTHNGTNVGDTHAHGGVQPGGGNTTGPH